jgi:hypothetical protein
LNEAATRSGLYNKVVLSGGSTLYKDLDRRLKKDIKKAVDRSSITLPLSLSVCLYLSIYLSIYLVLSISRSCSRARPNPFSLSPSLTLFLSPRSRSLALSFFPALKDWCRRLKKDMQKAGDPPFSCSLSLSVPLSPSLPPPLPRASHPLPLLPLPPTHSLPSLPP